MNGGSLNPSAIFDKIPGAGTDYKISSKTQPFIMATAGGQIGIPANTALAVKPAYAPEAQSAYVDACT
jgi:hypothetical protein